MPVVVCDALDQRQNLGDTDTSGHEDAAPTYLAQLQPSQRGRPYLLLTNLKTGHTETNEDATEPAYLQAFLAADDTIIAFDDDLLNLELEPLGHRAMPVREHLLKQMSGLSDEAHARVYDMLMTLEFDVTELDYLDVGMATSRVWRLAAGLDQVSPCSI